MGVNRFDRGLSLRGSMQRFVRCLFSACESRTDPSFIVAEKNVANINADKLSWNERAVGPISVPVPLAFAA